jgi:hypothetical protein
MKKIIKPQTFRELGKFDVAELSKLVATLPDSLWAVEDERKENDFTVFHHTQHIIFRFTPGNRDHTKFYTNPIWHVWQSRLLPLMDAITDQYEHQERVYSKIMLARLLPRQIIDRHVDGAGANLYTHKVHVPLITSPHVEFLIEEDVRHLEVGQAYEVNNIVRHGVNNPTDTARVHLIFEHFDAAA